MLKRHKDLLRSVVAQLRAALAGAANADGSWLRGDLDRELERLGIAQDGSITPLDALPQATAAERRAYAVAGTFISEVQRGQSSAKNRVAGSPADAARTEFVERAAYNWINRLLALRTMEARGLIEETLRNNPDYGNISEALYVLRQTEPQRTQSADGGWWAVIEDACRTQATHLPGLFDMDDPVVALRPSTPALRRCIELIGAVPAGFTLAEADAAFADPDAIGWCYQFYQEAAKDQVYAKLGSGGKAATRAEIAAATQLFTEPYMVQWLLQNSVGRSYYEAYPDTRLHEQWAYYIRQRPEGQTAPESPRPLSALDLIDPCCGSGHFLREAFDMFVAMYRERHADWSAAQIADRVLEQHLHGIDLDPRAAQLAVVTLYMRAWELVRDERRSKRQPGPGSYKPKVMNIATTPSGLSSGALQRHLRRHPEDRVLKPLLEGVFTALEQADILGSLLRPAEHIDAAIKALQQPHTVQMDFDADDAALRRTITRLAQSDPDELKRTLLDKVATSFHAEAGDADVAAALFGREAEQGVRLLQLLDRKYAVVVTNPPYMGSKNMSDSLKKYVEQHYPTGKRDLYTTFILRCLELCYVDGYVAMITLHTFIASGAFKDFRRSLLKKFQFNQFIHLGTGTLKSLSNTNAQGFCMYTISSLSHQSQNVFIRLIDCEDKQSYLNSLMKNFTLEHPRVFIRETRAFQALPDCQIIYWVSDAILSKFAAPERLGSIANVPKGLTTADNDRYLRYHWEAPGRYEWRPYVKGGGYKKWHGFNWYAIRWNYHGERVKAFPNAVVRNESFYDVVGCTYTEVANKSLGVRYLAKEELFDARSPGIFPKTINEFALLGVLNSRVTSFLFRCLSPNVLFDQAYAPSLPVPSIPTNSETSAQVAWNLKRFLVSTDLLERDFSQQSKVIFDVDIVLNVSALLHLIEGFLEKVTFEGYNLSSIDKQQVILETGMPAGFHPLIAGYDSLPELPGDLNLPSLPQEVLAYFVQHERIEPKPQELARINARLRALYEAGPGAKQDEESAESEVASGDDEEAAVSGAHIPIPTETFLEELAVKMQLHPISVYWLLAELRAEGARCKPEERRLLEDRLSVLVLRLLGHRWPKQIEAGESLPTWADRDGIIPITGGTGETTLAERVRAQLRAEDGDIGAQQTEALLHELTNLSLEEWLRREFFKRHVRQFKYRPIAWHLVSDPSVTAPMTKGKKGGGKRQPAFECLLYYHACGSDVLAKIRTQYVEPLLRTARHQFETATRANDDTTADITRMRVQELEDFNGRLQRVAESGFACPELDAILANEPLDRWSGDGYLAPRSHDDLLRQEQAWLVDLNDGVRVNIAPVQRAGLLLSDVLKAADTKKAIADRARWRSDERRWVRAGKLPRCGWMPDSVLESEKWKELATQREAERIKLEQKRQAALNRVESEMVSEES